MKWITIMRAFFSIFLLFFSMHSTAKTAGMRFHGTLIEPPLCSIKGNDGGNMIDVSFGDTVRINKVDGTNYLQTIPYHLECEDTNHQGLGLKLKIIGRATDFDPAAIQSNIDNLGIRIFQNDTAFVLNSALVIENKPKLTAVLVKWPGKTLKPEPFYATATLVASYE